MPVNPGIEYQLAEEEYRKANTVQEKIKTLENMLAKCPKHKSSENLQKQIKTRLSKLKTQIEHEKKQKSKGFQISIKKEGAAQIAIIGTTNSGKSFLLSKLTNAKPVISEVAFTTKLPEVGIMDYNGIKLQIVEIPAISEGFMNKGKGPLFLGLIRNADLVLILLRNNYEKEFNLLINELDKSNIKINMKKPDYETYTVYLKGLIILNGIKDFKIRGFDTVNITDDLKEEIWKNLDLIYVFTKMPGKKPSYPPVALKKGSCVKDLALIVHKDFVKKFRYARIWGKSVKYNGLQVGLDHKLEAKDIVELHLK